MSLIELQDDRIMIDYEVLLARILQIRNNAEYNLSTLENSPSIERFEAMSMIFTVQSVERLLEWIIEQEFTTTES